MNVFYNFIYQFDEKLLEKIWKKGIKKEDYPPEGTRFDEFGSRIDFNAYGDSENDFGWEVDHIKRESDGGTEDIKNLRPLYWRNNRARGAKNDNLKTFYSYNEVTEKNDIEEERKDN